MITTKIKSTENDIHKMFVKIATKYDLLNNLMTISLHKKWKKEMIRLALKEIPNPKNAIDLCSGTGDLAIIINELYQNTNILCIDNCNEMLKIAKDKTQKLNLKNVNFLLSNVEDLSHNEFKSDLITIGFGLRNVINKEKCIENIYKILNNNGVFACIDLGHPTNLIWKKIFFYYFFNIVPKLGQIFAKDKDAYSYLPNSLLTYYNQEELKQILLKKGFRKCYYKNILGGIIAIHIAVK